ncbi:class I SAM-dependent methyltransferase [Lacicoccus alkaliphilus]|uniref:Ubiquinone/menaquinone biosynthesis C-methylase UbiE n=1 Tax=Lacicoccus alkaliphilus DSM 16010 TaxID=1123231 RepID=A0A1M7JAK3_9BACL|nr:class I SAM-dependent methyltransferase [Salinicoccus alkaliphilus]SHM49893.1 Ubiquinone/menaquinone biosynthesis C-methylase UbiE [Salinicoccus alkaliphilus DSM 16010]
MDTEKHIKKFDKQVGIYERMRNNDRFHKHRSALFGGAYGEVLEVAVGTGLNFPHYKGVDHLTAVDFSKKMLESAEKEAVNHPFPVQFINEDVEALTFADNSFDTIVSSLSFCSYEHPGEVLNRFNRWCRPGGRILLLEHGLGRSKVLQVIQKAVDPLTMRTIGCHQKRDISKIVGDSDLEIMNLERRVFGAVYLVEAAPQR